MKNCILYRKKHQITAKELSRSFKKQINKHMPATSETILSATTHPGDSTVEILVGEKIQR